MRHAAVDASEAASSATSVTAEGRSTCRTESGQLQGSADRRPPTRCDNRTFQQLKGLVHSLDASKRPNVLELNVTQRFELVDAL